MKRLALALVALALVALAAVEAGARADARLAIPSDAVAVASLRPVGALGALGRIGSGWGALARRSLPFPQAVNPLDPSLLATVGVDPAATAWASVRSLRGGVHLRVALPLSNARVAEALLQSAARLANIELARGPKSSWTGLAKHGEPVLARLDGSTLVLDVLFPGAAAPPSMAELARLLPLAPPRAWSPTKGAGRRVAAEDAAAVWVDLPAFATLAITQSEAQIAAAVKHVEPAQRGQLARVAHEEIATCRAAAAKLPATFDDMRLAVSVRGPDSLGLELAFGGRRAALEPLRGHASDSAIRATHALTGLATDAELRLLVTDPALVRALAHFPLVAADVPQVCSGPAAEAMRLRSWPSSLQQPALATWMHLVGGLRGLIVTLSAADLDGPAFSLRQLVSVAEVEPSARGDLDSLLAGHLGAVAPLRVGSQQLSAYALPRGLFSGGEGPLVVVTPLDSGAGGALVGFGGRDPLRVALERLQSGTNEPSVLGSLSATPRGLARVLHQLGDGDNETGVLLDGLTNLEAALKLDADVLQLDATWGLRPAGAR